MSVERGFVVYVAAENPVSVQNRVWAWMQHHKVADLDLAVVYGGINLSQLADARRLVRLIQEIEQPPVLVVIDTLARAMMGDENSAEEMGEFVRSCEEIRNAFGCHVLIIHHTGKDLTKGSRGSSALRAAVDTEVEVSRVRNEVRALKITKVRDGKREGERYGLKLVDVPLGPDADGRTDTTAVIEPLSLAEPDDKGKVVKLGANEMLLKQVFEDLARDGTLSYSEWREAAMRRLETKRPDKAFVMAATGLHEKGVVFNDGERAMTFAKWALR
jgi:hypothetical protein